MNDIQAPDYSGSSLVNLIASVETWATGDSQHPVLADRHGWHPSDASTTVLVLFDGLGAHQLSHPLAAELARSLRSTIDAPFPSTTTVSLSTIATGRTAAEHGMLGYLMWLPEAGKLVNTIHMRSAWGEPVDIDLDRFLPTPNLWERLATGGVDTIVVQPGNFADSALTRVLYRGARFEGYWNPGEAVDVTVDVASHERRLVFLYVPFVDLAAHLAGQASDAYRDAMATAAAIWRELSSRLPDEVTLVGTADHGHIDIPVHRRIELSNAAMRDVRLFGDGRALYVKGDPGDVLEELPGTWVPRPDLDRLWGSVPLNPGLEGRAPDGVILVAEGHAGLTDVMNPAMVGHHGGLAAEEREIPILVRG